MSHTVACACGKTIRVKDDYAGKRIRCPGCGAPLVVPDGGPPRGEEDEPGSDRPVRKRRAGKGPNRAPASNRTLFLLVGLGCGLLLAVFIGLILFRPRPQPGSPGAADGSLSAVLPAFAAQDAATLLDLMPTLEPEHLFTRPERTQLDTARESIREENKVRKVEHFQKDGKPYKTAIIYRVPGGSAASPRYVIQSVVFRDLPAGDHTLETFVTFQYDDAANGRCQRIEVRLPTRKAVSETDLRAYNTQLSQERQARDPRIGSGIPIRRNRSDLNPHSITRQQIPWLGGEFRDARFWERWVQGELLLDVTLGDGGKPRVATHVTGADKQALLEKRRLADSLAEQTSKVMMKD